MNVFETKRRLHKLYSSLENYFHHRGKIGKAMNYSKMATGLLREDIHVR